MNYTDIENSANISRVGYHPKDKMLEVTFTSGKTYRYEQVPKALHEGMLTAKSVGGFFQANVRDKFKTVEVLDDPTTREAKAQLKEIKAILERRVQALRECAPERMARVTNSIQAGASWDPVVGFQVVVTGDELDEGRMRWRITLNHHDYWRMQVLLTVSGFVDTIANAMGFGRGVGDAD